MHYNLEVIMPPTDDIETALGTILEQFDENYEDEEMSVNSNGFWDWYQIGGRWSGAKIEAFLDKEKKDAFYEKLGEMDITVSGMSWGKQELQPADQIEAVDALWREWFPESGVEQCPFFKHFDDANNLDICTLEEVSPDMEAYHVIIAVPSNYDGKLTTKTMYMTELWNGVSFQKTEWDGNLLNTVKAHNERMTEDQTVKDDWLVVTVDYHS
jgi:hypothetical protein